MDERESSYKDRTRVLIAIGCLLLLVGLVAALLGPVEIYCFYLFIEGGRFHYPGFGFGSLMFALIAWQVIGYYAIAAVCIPLGYGHLRLRPWARTLSVGLLWCGLVVGLPLTVVFLAELSVKELSPVAGALVVLGLGLSYLILPGLLIRFYHSHDVRRTFEARDGTSCWIERLPMPVLVLALLLTLYAGAMHVPLFFNGIFPLFGTWLSGLEGMVALDLSILVLACLTWGTVRQRAWAWWGGVGILGLLTVSATVTLIGSSLAEILTLMRFPPTEMEMLAGVPLHGAHLAPFLGIPLAITLGVILLSKRHFEP